MFCLNTQRKITNVWTSVSSIWPLLVFQPRGQWLTEVGFCITSYLNSTKQKVVDNCLEVLRISVAYSINKKVHTAGDFILKSLLGGSCSLWYYCLAARKSRVSKIESFCMEFACTVCVDIPLGTPASFQKSKNMMQFVYLQCP